MSNRKKRHRQVALSRETRTADFLTVAWLLSVMTAVACELGFVATAWFAGTSQGMATLAAFLFFAALAVGTVSLVLSIVVVRIRRVRPPHGVVVFSLVVGATPWAIVVLNWLW